MDIIKSDIRLSVNGRAVNAHLARPETGGPGVLVLHAWWGLTPFFKQICNRLAEQGYTALAPDLYQGRIAGSSDEAKALSGSLDQKFAEEAVRAAKAHLASLTGGKLAVIGFSMGAAWAIVLTASEPDLAATVLFYGTYIVDFSQARAKVLGHFAETDEWEPLEGVRELEAALKFAGLDVSFHIYPETSHWFAEEDRPEYNHASTQLAWERTFEFLRRSLA